MTRRKRNDAGRNFSTELSRGRELYLDALGREAVERAGCGPQLKGVMTELAIRDLRNTSVRALILREVTRLTRSTNARSVDLVTVGPNGRVVARLQVKDLTSESSIRDLLHRLESGQYRSTRLVGTRETAARYAATGSRKSMESSGVSSTTTTRAADNAGVRVPNKNLLLNNAEDIGKFAGGVAVVGGVLGGAAEAWGSYDDLLDGRIDGLQYTGRVAGSAAKGAGGAAAKTASALALKEGGKALAKQAGSQTLKRLAGSNIATAVAFGVVEQAVDTGRLVTGNIDGAEYGKRSLQNVGGTGGALGGAVGGAALGTAICPGVGTAIGGLIGGIACGVGGGMAGRVLGGLFWGDE